MIFIIYLQKVTLKEEKYNILAMFLVLHNRSKIHKNSLDFQIQYLLQKIVLTLMISEHEFQVQLQIAIVYLKNKFKVYMCRYVKNYIF
jgi:hypothetical protein